MWNSPCEDAEPSWDWSSQQAQKEETERQHREWVAKEPERRAERAAARMEQQRRISEACEKKKREDTKKFLKEHMEEEQRRQAAARNEAEKKEQERREAEVREEAAREEAARKEQERKEQEAQQALAKEEATRKQQERRERRWKEKQEYKDHLRNGHEAYLALKSKRDKQLKREKAEQMNDLKAALHKFLLVLQKRNAETTGAEEEDAVLGAEEDRDLTSPYDDDRSADAARTRSQILTDTFGVKKTTNEDDGSQTRNEKSVDPKLVSELDHLEDLLRAMAESLRTEKEERVRSEDTTKDQPPAAGWFGTCVLM